MEVEPRRGFLVAQIGARRRYAVARALNEAGLLETLHVDACAAVPPWSWLDRCVPRALRRGGLGRILGRRPAGVPAERIRGDFGYTCAVRIGGRNVHETQWARWTRQNALFAERCAQRGFGSAAGVYVYNGAGLELLRAARREGVGCIVDQTAAPLTEDARLLREEVERWPGWATAYEDMRDAEAGIDREQQEWALADRIVCGSPYVARTLAVCGVEPEKCHVVPHAIQTITSADAAPARGSHAGPLRILFVGTVCLRKGVPYLIEALEPQAPGSVECRMAGSVHVGVKALERVRRVAKVLGQLQTRELERQYDWADALVLPTLSEGSANVCAEALARGLPAIVTWEAGSVVRDGLDGWIVPRRDSEALRERIAQLAGDRAICCRFASMARLRGGELTWARYVGDLRAAIGAQ